MVKSESGPYESIPFVTMLEKVCGLEQHGNSQAAMDFLNKRTHDQLIGIILMAAHRLNNR